MARTTSALALAVLLGLPLFGRAAEPVSREALALQDAFQEAIRRAEPSIACILVSRSDIYRRWFRQTPPPDYPGRLGDFSPNATANIPLNPEDTREKNEYLKLLERRIRPNNPFQRQHGLERELAILFDLADPNNVPDSYGSGVVLNDRGMILTNYHVVRDAAKVYVRLPGKQGSYADIYAADPRSDLAVLQLLRPGLRPPALQLGDGGQLRKGQLVLSLANPFAAGFQDGSPSASWGIISNLRRRTLPPASLEQERNRYQLQHMATLVQTDARLNLGCSGGALLNLQGEWVGLTTALAAITGSETAGGFALPLDAPIRQIIAVLERGEDVAYGFLGVGLGPGNELRRNDSIKVSHVVPGSAAQRAGLEQFDIILSVNGRPIRETDDLFLNLGICLAGSDAQLEIKKSTGVRRSLKVTLDKFYVPMQGIVSSKPPFVRGMRVDYTSVLQQRDKLQECPPGVYVCEIEPGSPSERARLHEAIITQVNGQPVHNPAEFYRRTSTLTGPLELTVTDHHQPRTVKLD
jgi:S1-C subfamily serine protease